MTTKAESRDAARKQLQLSGGQTNGSNTRKILTHAIALWHSVFPNPDARDLELILTAYSKVLARLSPEQLEATCERVLERCRFFPTPAEILELAGERAVQSIELEAESAWQALLDDFKFWGNDRAADGRAITSHRTVPRKKADPACPHCQGNGWAPVEGDLHNGFGRCHCTAPAVETVPELPDPALYALSRLGGYQAVHDQIESGKAGWIRKDFIDAFVYFRKTSGLTHLPAGKTDAAMLHEIESRAGTRLLKD